MCQVVMDEDDTLDKETRYVTRCVDVGDLVLVREKSGKQQWMTTLNPIYNFPTHVHGFVYTVVTSNAPPLILFVVVAVGLLSSFTNIYIFVNHLRYG